MNEVTLRGTHCVMGGIAEGGVYDQQAVRFYSLAIGIISSCTVIAVSGMRTFFGRDYDSGP